MASEPQTKIVDLPTEVLVSIFSLLPITDLARVAATCDRFHGIVISFPRVWKGKCYRSEKKPAQCPETRAVLQVLPPFPRISIQSTMGFMVEVRYPHLILQVKYIDVIGDLPRLRCEYLSVRLDIAGVIFTYRTTIDFESVKRLRVLRIWHLNFWGPRIFSFEYVARKALLLCPNLNDLSLLTDFMSGDYLDMIGGLRRLQYLGIHSHGLRNLSFLRHCREELLGLLLVGYKGLQSRELDHVGRLRNLRMLMLGACQFSEGHMAAILAELANLELLNLKCCSIIHDLSILRHCSQLHNLNIVNTLVAHKLGPAGEERQLGGLVLCNNQDDRHLVGVMIVTVTADNLTTALSKLQDRGLPETCVAYLAALGPCSQLRYICCEFTTGTDEMVRLNVRIKIYLPSSA